MKSDQKSSILINYIDKLYVNMQTAGKFSYQLGLLNLFLSILLVAFSYQLIGIKREITVSNISFEIKATEQITFLVLSAFVTITYVLASGIGSHSRKLREHIRRLYKQLDFNDISMEDSPNSLEHPHIIGHIFDFRRITHRNTVETSSPFFIYRFLLLFLIIFFPFLAQIWPTYNFWLLTNRAISIVYANTPFVVITFIEIVIYLLTPHTIKAK